MDPLNHLFQGVIHSRSAEQLVNFLRVDITDQQAEGEDGAPKRR